jgi:hypothetical protein
MMMEVHMTKCEKCKTNTGFAEDMQNNISNLLLCDDCYTEIRYMIADELDISLQQLNI